MRAINLKYKMSIKTQKSRTMKRAKLKIFMLLMAAIMVSVTACKKDDDPANNPSTTVKDTEYVQTELKNDDGEVVELIVNVVDYGKGTGTITWEATKTYVLSGLVFINDGQTLNIEAGTIVKGKSGQGENASALIVAKGGIINAVGNASAPIIFCAEADNTHYDHVEGMHVNGDNIPPTTRGLWGGIIMLGKATTNNSTTEKSIEGIPTTEERGKYGGSDDADNSGILKYVSIRNGGTNIGEGNEINGLTMGAVGSGTEIDYVEVIGNKDDGFEWFSSTVTCKHLISAFNGDDSFDYDEGFRGNGQFWFVVQDPEIGDRIGEHDGGPSDNEFGAPYASPHIYNVTYIGRGADAGKRLITFRDNAGGFYHNSIFTNQAKGIDIEWLDGSDSSYDQWVNGNLDLTHNIFWGIADGTAAKLFTVGAKDGVTVPEELLTDWANHFALAMNSVEDPGIVSDATMGMLNPVPSNDVSANMATAPAGFETVNYKGAFDPSGNNWAKGWSKVSTYFAE
jgi:hypothetical protein